MAKEIARYSTAGGGTVTLHRGGLLASLAGDGIWYQCTACPDRINVTNWSNSAQADLVDHDATEKAAKAHASNCHRIPQR